MTQAALVNRTVVHGQLHKVLRALPRMPKIIVDDTRHEKVLSYVSALISQDIQLQKQIQEAGEQQQEKDLITIMVQDWNVMTIFLECLADNQDFRVSCVALRLLGTLLEFDSQNNNAISVVWQTLETDPQHHTLLEAMVKNTESEEALCRYSAWFALQRLMLHDGGAKFLLSTGQCPRLVTLALKDTSSYVLTAACQFLLAIVDNCSIQSNQQQQRQRQSAITAIEYTKSAHDILMDNLLESISLYNLIHTMLCDSQSERNRLSGLEFLWTVVQSDTIHAQGFLQESGLMRLYMKLLQDSSSRMVASRMQDVMMVFMDTHKDPLGALANRSLESLSENGKMEVDFSDAQNWQACFEYLLVHDILELLKVMDEGIDGDAEVEDGVLLRNLQIIVGFLESMVKPLAGSKQGVEATFSQQLRSTIISVLVWIVEIVHEALLTGNGVTTTVSTTSTSKVGITIQGLEENALVQYLNLSETRSLAIARVQSDLVSTGPRKRQTHHHQQQQHRPTSVAARNKKAMVQAKSLVLAAFKPIQSMAKLFPETVSSQLGNVVDIVLAVVTDQVLCGDQRVFKACLTTLPLVLGTRSRSLSSPSSSGSLEGRDAKEGKEQLVFAKTIRTLIGLIKQPTGTTAGSSALKLILTAVQEFFKIESLGQMLLLSLPTSSEDYQTTSLGQDLASVLEIKLYDVEWDVRDNVVEFLGQLFVSPAPTSTLSTVATSEANMIGMQWCLQFLSLEQTLFQKLSDQEAYVRATAVTSFQQVMQQDAGWHQMCSTGLDQQLRPVLQELIHDSEAFVRRAVLEVLICLVKEKQAASSVILLSSEKHNLGDNSKDNIKKELFVDAKFMSRLTLDDADWEVRIRACEFLEAVWEHCKMLQQGDDFRQPRSAKRSRIVDSAASDAFTTDDDKNQLSYDPSWWFYDIRGDKILIEATKDESRMVRWTTVEILKRVLMWLRSVGLEKVQASSQTTNTNDVLKATTVETGTGSKRTATIDSSVSGQDLQHCQQQQQNQQQEHPHLEFFKVLQALDFERLDASTSVEQLYEEVLNVDRVEDVVMDENEQPNDGNNVLDCY